MGPRFGEPSGSSAGGPSGRRWGFSAITTLLVVVYDLDVVGSAVPREANAPLIVDPDRPLTGAITCQALQPVAGRVPELLQPARLVELLELPSGRPLDIVGEHVGCLSPKHPRGLLIAERVDHAVILSVGDTIV